MNTVASRTSTAALLSLIFGIICWFVLPIVGAIIAIVCGHVARDEIRRAPAGTIEGSDLARVGSILGWINLILWTCFIVLVLFFFIGLPMLYH